MSGHKFVILAYTQGHRGESLLSCIARREIWGGDNEFLGRNGTGAAACRLAKKVGHLLLLVQTTSYVGIT